MSMKYNTGKKNMYDDTSDESLSDTHFRQSEVDESNKKKKNKEYVKQLPVR